MTLTRAGTSVTRCCQQGIHSTSGCSQELLHPSNVPEDLAILASGAQAVPGDSTAPPSGVLDEEGTYCAPDCHRVATGVHGHHFRLVVKVVDTEALLLVLEQNDLESNGGSEPGQGSCWLVLCCPLLTAHGTGNRDRKLLGHFPGTEQSQPAIGLCRARSAESGSGLPRSRALCPCWSKRHKSTTRMGGLGHKTLFWLG